MRDKKFASRLVDLVKEFSDGKYSIFARNAGIAVPTFQKYLLGESLPGFEVIAKMCRYTGISADWLILGTDPKYRSPKQSMEFLPPPNLNVLLGEGEERYLNESQVQDCFRPVPILKGDSLTLPLRVTESDISGYTLMPQGEATKCQALFRIKEKRMSPLLEPGDLVGVNMKDNDPQSLHEKVVAVCLDRGVSFHRLRFSDKFCLLSPEDTNQGEPIILPSKRAAHIFLGTVGWCWKSL